MVAVLAHAISVVAALGMSTHCDLVTFRLPDHLGLGGALVHWDGNRIHI